MNPDFRIYSAPADEIPAEDKARLDGFLKGRAEADTQAEVDELKQQIRELEARAAKRDSGA